MKFDGSKNRKKTGKPKIGHELEALLSDLLKRILAQRWALSIKSEYISGLIFFGDESLLRALKEHAFLYHQERNHQGKDNRLKYPVDPFY